MAAGPVAVPDQFPRRIRTTIRPDEDLVVGRAEWVDLTRAGLIIEDEYDQYSGFVPTALHPRTDNHGETDQKEE